MSTPNESRSNANAAHLLLREVWSRGDLGLIDELVTEDHLHHDPLLPAPLEGPDALKEWVTTVRAGASNLTKTIRETYLDDDAVIVTYTTTGTHEGEIMGIAPTGRPFEVNGVYVHHVKDGKIAETLDTWDGFGLFTQLGSFPEVV